MKVEIWTDIACPFCYIGKVRFEKALSLFEYKEKVEVIYRAFPLNPEAQKVNDKNIHQLLAEKYGVSYEQAKNWNTQITEQAAELGIVFDFERLVPTNTVDALRTLLFAQENGLGNEMNVALLKSYFENGLDISSHEVLGDLAEEVGLEKREILDVLGSDKFMQQVDSDIQLARMYGVTGVPFYKFASVFAVSGAQSSEVFLQALTEAWDKNMAEKRSFGSASSCGDEGCMI